MSISLFEAIKNVRDDKSWVLKIFVASVLMFLSSLLVNLTELNLQSWITTIAVLLGITCGAYVFGFLFKSVHNALNSDSFELAKFSDTNLFLVGLKGWLAYIGYYTVMYLIAILIFVVLGIVFALFLMVIYGLLVSVLGLGQNVILGLSIIVGAILVTIISLYLGMFINIATVCYLKRLNFTDIFAIDVHFAIVKENHHVCWSFIGKTILFMLLFMLVFLILAISIIGWLLIPFIYTYSYLVYYNLQVQFAKTIQIERYIEN